MPGPRAHPGPPATASASSVQAHLEQGLPYDEDVAPLALPELVFDGLDGPQLLGCIQARQPVYVAYAKRGADRRSQEVGLPGAAGAGGRQSLAAPGALAVRPSREPRATSEHCQRSPSLDYSLRPAPPRPAPPRPRS